ncbi:uncharacterized protein LOC124279514 [Haliotis rubra]|uniref:uncharacterized protein LOC124279514 n=1 Tax=Haliotis rubra TaxID=36100 RepID=UPI001EE4FFAE|nr:uncharacterized protein LOC124279514 [Haliotis rubra]
MAGIKKIRTSPYNPRCNGVTERMNRTLLDMLGTLNHSQKKDWRKYVGPLAHAYNCIVHDTTGYSPYYLMFGRHARLPVDMVFGTDPDSRTSKGPQQYVKDLRDRLQFAFQVARENAKKSAIRNKGYYDRKAHAAALEPDDRVLVRNIGVKGKHKIADRWKSGVYIVERHQGELPVYVVRPENGDGPSKTYHRNLLLPVGSLPLDMDEPERNQCHRQPVTRSRALNHQPEDTLESSEDELHTVNVWYPQPDTIEAVPTSSLNPEARPFEPQEQALPYTQPTVEEVPAIQVVPGMQNEATTAGPLTWEMVAVEAEAAPSEPMESGDSGELHGREDGLPEDLDNEDTSLIAPCDPVESSGGEPDLSENSVDSAISDPVAADRPLPSLPCEETVIMTLPEAPRRSQRQRRSTRFFSWDPFTKKYCQVIHV